MEKEKGNEVDLDSLGDFDHLRVSR